MLAAAMLITVFPFSAAAEEGEDKKDITIQWGQVTQESSDKAAVTLSAGLSADSEVQSATVNIKLTEEEKSALTTPLPDGFELESWQEETVESDGDGDDTTTVIESAPEGIPAAGGEGSVSNTGDTTSELPATTAAQPTDYRLSFMLQKSGSVESVSVFNATDETMIEISDEDVKITDAVDTEGTAITDPSFEMEPSPFAFSLSEQKEEPNGESSENEEGEEQDGQDTSQQGDDDTKEEEPEKEDEQVLPGDNGSPDEQVIVSVDEGSGSLIVDENSLDDFSFSIQGLSVPTEEHTPNTYAITLTLPEGVIPPADVTANGATITTGESGDVAAFTLNDNESGVTATIDKESLSAEANTLSFTLALAKEQESLIAAAVNAIAGVFARTDNSDSGVAGTLEFYGNAFSVDYDTLFDRGTSDDTRSITLSVDDGESASITLTAPEVAEEDKYTQGEGATTNLFYTVNWIDNNNSGNTRPGDFYPKEINYAITGANGYSESGTLNETTLVKLGFVGENGEPNWPTNTAAPNGISITLPTLLTKTVTSAGNEGEGGDEGEGEQTETTYYRVDWTLEPPEVAGYALQVVGDEWYYIKTEQFTLNLDLKEDNDGYPSEEQVAAILSHFSLYGSSESEETEVLGFKFDFTGEEAGTGTVTLETGENAPQFTVTYSYSEEKGEFTIYGLPSYTLSGNADPITYWVQKTDVTEATEEEDAAYQISAEDLGDAATTVGLDKYTEEDKEADLAPDYLKIEYLNTNLANYGDITSEVYSGGTLRLTRVGETTYQAVKVWLDNLASEANKTGRPDATYDLWRYTTEEASQVRNANGQFISVTYSADESCNELEEVEDAGDKYSGYDAYYIRFKDASSVLIKLDKYDQEGRKYTYGVRETLGEDNKGRYEQVLAQVTTQVTAEEPEEGEAAGDKQDSSTTLTEITDWYIDTMPDGTTEKGETEEKANEWRSEKLDASTQDLVFNGGVLSNRLTGQVQARVTKTWDAAAFQSDLLDVAVEFTLYQRIVTPEGEEPVDENDWVVAKNESGEEVTYIMYGFRAENMTSTYSAYMPQYDAEGNKLEYMWVETAVYEQKSGEPISDLFTNSENPDGGLTQEQIKQELEDAAKEEGATVTKTKLNTDGAPDNDSSDPFTLGHKTTSEDGDDTVEYESISSYEDNKTTITNRIADTIEYAIEKVWEGEDGTVTAWPAEGPQNVTMNIYRLPSGSSMTESGKANLYVSVTIGKDGNVGFADDSPNDDGLTLVLDKTTDSHFKDSDTDNVMHGTPDPDDSDPSNETNGWDAIIQGLPKYDENGNLYTYILVEGDAGEYHPDYQTKYYPDGCYSTIVTNGEGGGQRIMVEKVWMDGGDDLHREPVKLEVRAREQITGGEDAEAQTYEKNAVIVDSSDVEATLTRDDSWYGYITLPTGVAPEDVYVVEVSVGENATTNESNKVTHYTGETENAETSEPTFDQLYGIVTNNVANGGEGYGRVETSHHRYEVTYAYTSAEANPLKEHLFTITNRRLGNVDMTVTKEWTAGTDEELKELLGAIQTELNRIETGTEGNGKKLALALWLDFELSEDERPEGWKITRNVPTADKTGGTGNEDDGMPSEGTTPVFDTVSIGGRAPSTIYKTLDGDGKTYSNPTTSVQILLNADTQTEDLQGAPKEYTFYGLPKYDSDGEVVKYDVEEAWVTVTTDAEGNSYSKVTNLETEYPDLYALWNEFDQRRTQDDYTAASENDRYDHDKQVIGINNARTGTKDVTWYKEWRDAYTEGQNQRPDIYLDIYALKTVGVNDDGTPKQQIEVVQQNYRWSVLDQEAEGSGDAGVTTYSDNGIMVVNDIIEPLNDVDEQVEVEVTYRNDQWSVTLNDMRKYDDYGNEIQYYAVERTVVHASDYDYQAVQYAAGVEDGIDIPSEGDKGEIIGNRDGYLNGVPVVKGENSEFILNTLDLKSNYTWENDAIKTEIQNAIGIFDSENGLTYPQYALLEDGTFINTLANTYTITGQKLWEGLDGYLDADSAALPTVTFNVYQYYQGDKIDSDANNAQLDVSKKVASLTVESEDWKHLRANENSSVFNFKIEYLGATTISETEGSQEGDEDWPYVNDEKDPLPLYDENGRRYVYVVQEVFDFVDDADSSASTEPGSGTDGQSDDPDTTESGYDHVYEVEVPNNQAANIVFTNTYEPDLGALKVKKILSLPANADSEGGGFPDLTFTLTRKYMVGDDLVEDTVYNNTSETSRSVTLTGTTIASAFETADKQDGNDVVLTFDDNIIFKDLPIYAPNGSKYVYTVTETGGLGGYDTFAELDDHNQEDFNNSEETSVVVEDMYPQQVTDVGSDPADEQIANVIKSGDAIATFYNKRQEKQDDTVILTGTKVWEDYGDAMGTRPPLPESPVTNSADDPLGLSVTRKSASGKTGTLTLGKDYTITYTENKAQNSWTFEIKGTEGSGELQKFATDGEAWIYVVTENTQTDSDLANAGYVATDNVSSWQGNAATANTENNNTVQLHRGGTSGNVTNSIYTDVPFEKRWEDENGNEIKEDYLNGLKLTVTFQLQVRTKNSNEEWSGLDTYFSQRSSALDTIDDYVIINDWTLVNNNKFTVTKTGKVTGTNWTGKFENLPKVIKVNGGKPIDLEYRVVETSVAYGENGNEVTQIVDVNNGGNAISPYDEDSVNPPEGTTGLVTKVEYEEEGNVTTNKLNTIQLEVQKEWDDGQNQFQTRPDTEVEGKNWEVWFVIQRTTDDAKSEAATWTNVEVVRVTGMNTADNGPAIIRGLPVADFQNGGADYTYRVRELKPNASGYELSRDNDSIAGNIIADGGTFAEDGNFGYTAAYKPDDGIAEPDNESTATVSVENILIRDFGEAESANITVTKKWQPDESAPEGSSVTLHLEYLLEGGTDWTLLPGTEVTLDGHETPTPWTHTWEDVPTKMTVGGSERDVGRFRVVEDAHPDNYVQLPTVDDWPEGNNPEVVTINFTITNVETTSFTVTKEWNPDTTTPKPEEVIVGLYRTTEKTKVGAASGEGFEAVRMTESVLSSDHLTVDLPDNDGDAWKHTFTGLPKYDKEGNLYRYYALELTENSDGTYTPIANNGSIMYDDDSYHVDYDHTADDETPVDPQSTTITNTPSTSLSGTKTWKDNSNAYGTRPDEETFKANLKLSWSTDNGSNWTVITNLDEQGIRLTIEENGNTWTYTFDNLPKYGVDTDGKSVQYTYKVEESALPGYSGAVDDGDNNEAATNTDGPLVGPDFTNTLTGTVTINGTKTWEGGTGAEPDLTLYRRADGEDDWEIVRDSDDQPIQPTWDENARPWTYTYTGLPKYNENGMLYQYRVTETDVEDGYDKYYTSGGNATDAEDNKTTDKTNTQVKNLHIRNVKRGSLTVSKQVTGNRGNYTRQFDFSVTFTLPEGFGDANGLPTISYTKTDAEGKLKTQSAAFVSDTLTIPFTLADDDSITFTNLPGGTTYDVDETNSYGHSPYPENDTGTIPPGGMATAKFVNHRNGGGGGDTPDPDEPDPEIPDEPTPGEDIPPDEPDTPDEPDNPDDPGTDIPDEPTPGEDVPPDEPGTDIPDEPTPGGDVPPDDPNTPDQPGKPGLPQTGQLWWPVLLLAAVGAVMSLVGLWNIKRYRGKHDKNKV